MAGGWPTAAAAAATELPTTPHFHRQESFDAFGATLMPILQRLGVDPGKPEVSEIHNIIKT